MLQLYYSNHLEIQKAILINLLKRDQLADPFHSEQILVQSQGMAQWLKLQIAAACGVAANIDFPLPSSFIWHQYHHTLANVPQHNAFEKEAMKWHLMSLIPELLDHPDFAAFFIALKRYLGNPLEQQKLYQLSSKIADLFDQYLVYRPEWIEAWEQQNEALIMQQMQAGLGKNTQMPSLLLDDIQSAVNWQGILWRCLYARISQQAVQQGEQGWHRAALHQDYLRQLAVQKPPHLPSRLFVFGISALPNVYLQTLQALAQHCEVHLFFNNPCQYYWGDIVDATFLRQLQLRQRQKYQQSGQSNWLNTAQQQQLDLDIPLPSGHPLLAAWGKMGRDFLYLLSQSHANEIDAYAQVSGQGLLAQLQNAILNLQPFQPNGSQDTLPFILLDNDDSLRIHACHSPMREVEILHDQLLHWLQQDKALTPKEIVVMVADVDKYVPYIHAVFSQYTFGDPRFIPYEIADRKHTHSDVIVTTFLNLLRMKDSIFSAETVLGLLDVVEVRERFGFDLSDLNTLKDWVAQNGIRYGLDAEQTIAEPNYNTWQSGLERMLLGSAMREADGIWQNSIAFDLSYGLTAQIAGKLGDLLQRLQQWHLQLQQTHGLGEWEEALQHVLQDFFAETEQSQAVLQFLSAQISDIFHTALATEFGESLESAVIEELLSSKLSEEDNTFRFLNGKLSFCTLMPMRSIPFKIVALLGMGEKDYPRQHNPSSFDLMQYAPQKGDRVRRDDDRYLFLEAILSAQQKLYISYVGRSLLDNQLLQPSVLVSQLLDYLVDQTACERLCDHDIRSEQVRQKLLQTHPMTIFSIENFTAENPVRSFAHEWLLNREIVPENRDFIQPLSAAIQQSEVIDLNQLISFVCHPLRYFFEKQLGVYFRDNHDPLADSENFNLDGLTRYRLSNRLLQQPSSQWLQQFEHFKLQGELPRAHFATLASRELSSSLQPLSQIIEPYLAQTAQSMAVSIEISVLQNRYRLQGDVTNLYSAQRVVWRSGSIKAAHQIENWLYYLVQTVQLQQVVQTPLFYGLEKDKVQCCRFAEITVQQAYTQLYQYIEDFIQAEQQLLLLPTARYTDFVIDTLNPKAKPKNDEQLLQAILELAKDSYQGYSMSDPYWKRVLDQHRELDLAAMKTKMQQWFRLMGECLQSR